MKSASLPLIILLALYFTSPLRGEEKPPGLTLLEAVQATLQNHPTLHIQEQQVRFNRGMKQQASGQFDATLVLSGSQANTNDPLTIFQQQQAAADGVTIADVKNHGSDIDAEYQKQYRNGITIHPVVTETRTADGLQNNAGTNITQAAFQLTLPLLRGRGRSAVAAQETSAELQVEASLFDLNQTIANLMAQTAENYWSLKAARLSLEVLVDSERRGRVFLDNVKALIAGDEVARGEINQVVANLDDRIASRIAAEQNVFEARQQLALAMGVPAQQLAAIGDALSDPIPEGENQPMPSDQPGDMEFYIDQSIAKRADVMASRKRADANEALRIGASNLLLPQLDLSVSTGYTGLREGLRLDQYFFSLKGEHSPDITFGFNYRFPPARNAAMGQVVQADASRRQAEFQTSEKAREAASDVIVATGALRNSIGRLARARESVDYYSLALEGERQKQRLANGSLLDVLQMEDRLNNAKNSWIQAKLAYAKAVVDFRLGTGTLIEPDKPVQNITEAIFITLPFLARPATKP